MPIIHIASDKRKSNHHSSTQSSSSGYSAVRVDGNEIRWLNKPIITAFGQLITEDQHEGDSQIVEASNTEMCGRLLDIEEIMWSQPIVTPLGQLVAESQDEGVRQTVEASNKQILDWLPSCIDMSFQLVQANTAESNTKKSLLSYHDIASLVNNEYKITTDKFKLFEDIKNTIDWRPTAAIRCYVVELQRFRDLIRDLFFDLPNTISDKHAFSDEEKQLITILRTRIKIGSTKSNNVQTILEKILESNTQSSQILIINDMLLRVNYHQQQFNKFANNSEMLYEHNLSSAAIVLKAFNC